MPLALVSDTAFLHRDLKQRIRAEVEKRKGRIAYVSSSVQESPRAWYCNTVKEFKQIDTRFRLQYFDLSDNFSDSDLTAILEFGTIHLSGGNTFEFIDSIARRDAHVLFTAHLKKNGLIIGVSAGAIVLTPSLMTARLSGDKAPAGLVDRQGLGMVPFEFFPHFTQSHPESQLPIIQEYSVLSGNTVLACPDGSGVVVDDSYLGYFGDILEIKEGRVQRLGEEFGLF